jgi:hypothetical protein
LHSILLCHLSIYLYILSFFGFAFYFAFLYPASSLEKIKSENMVALVQIFHEFVTIASMLFQYVTVGNTVTVVQLTVLGQKGRPGE